MREVPSGPPDQVPRLERYRREHPDVDIQPPGARSAVWRAFRDGDLIAYGFTLMVFLDRLEALPEPLGVAQYFGLHPPGRYPPRGHQEVLGHGTAGPGMLNSWSARRCGPEQEESAPARSWIINLAVPAAVLEADLGHRKITRSRLIRPHTIAAMIGALRISGVILAGDDRSLTETTGAPYTEQDARAARIRAVPASPCRGRVGAGPAPGR